MFNKIKNYNLIEPKYQKNNSSDINTLIILNNYKIIDDAIIIKAINLLKNNAAPGHDNITPKILKENFLSYLMPLLHILNSSIS